MTKSLSSSLYLENYKYEYFFMAQWLMEHSDFMNNLVYLGSDSYAGIVNSILAEHIINGNLY